MQKYYLPILLLLSTFTAWGQTTFTDDFESYTAGQNIAAASPVWATWSGNVATEDAPVSTDQAKSGTKSIKLLASSANGGPSDILLPFGGTYELGDFTLEFWMFVVSGKGGYFNFQANATAGQKWSADFFFDKNGTMDCAVDGASIAVINNAAYPVGSWFKFKAELNLSANKWKVSINNNVVGNFTNPSNKVSSMNLYAYGPSGSVGHYYVDDVSYSYTPLIQKPNDAVMFGLSSRTLGLTGDQLPVNVQVRNIGLNAITSFDAEVNNGTTTLTYPFSNQNIASGTLFTANLPSPYTLIDGLQNVKVTIKNVNGGVDDDPSNNEGTAVLRGYTPAANKSVVVEEATGTWCQWCIRGIVYMKLMRDRYPNRFVGIGVHNADPMAIAEYDAGLTSFPGFTGFPSVVLQRKSLMDPSAMELPFLEEITKPAPASIRSGADFDASTGALKISVTASFTQAVSGVYRLNAVLVEDEVTGLGTGWSQKNAYAGGAAGPMGGYETKPATIPASLMVYDDVARAILGGFFGKDNSVPSSVAAGTEVTANFAYTINNAINDFDKMHVVGILTGPDGDIINAKMITLEEAVNNGFVLDVNNVIAQNKVAILPNPAHSIAYINVSLMKSVETSVRIFNTIGQEVTNLHYGNLHGDQVLPIDVADLNAGVYTVQVIAGGQTLTQKLIVE
jgi:hypothetical protein